MLDDTRKALAPTQAEINALPMSSNGKMARELIGERKGRALDIGCGEGKFTRGLASHIAEVSGIDVKANKIAEAREAARRSGVAVDFQVGSGEAIPSADASFEVVAFFNSLHHMPRPGDALREAARVLTPGGLLYVMEPVPAGNYHEATKLVNDETVVRTEAYREMARLPGVGMTSLHEIMYRSRREVADFEEWRADQLDRDIKRKARFDAQPDLVRKTFESSADHVNGKLAFDQVFRVNVLRKG